MLQLENVRKNYPDFALDCTMEVRPGQITGLIGKNGAGKTTAFKAALGLIKTDGGTVRIFGKPVSEFTPGDREDVGVVLADSGFSDYQNVRDTVSMLKRLYSKFDEEYFLRKCREFHLPEKKLIKEFSTGMKRRLQLIAAISHDAKLLILDEPTSGLDVVARGHLLDILREYMETEGRAILISSHIAGDLESICDDIYMIDNGKIIFHEDTDVLLGDYGLLKVTDDQYKKIDKSYVIRSRREEFGWSLLTGEKQFYMENYPDIVVEKGGIDEVIRMMIRGEQ